MLHLVLDFGNTCIKAGSFSGTKMQEVRIYANIEELLKDVEFVNKHNHAIVCSVTNDHLKFTECFKKVTSIVFTSETIIPIENLYKSNTTLGSDRLAASIGAFSLYPNTNVLCIDCGTCIKYNFVSAKNSYLGGGISPGLKMRFAALNHFTNKLPLVNLEENYDKLVGENTNESILSGVIIGTTKEIEGIIEEYSLKYPDIKIVITGGDGNFFAKHLKKNSIFTHPDLVLIGLNNILSFTLENN